MERDRLELINTLINTTLTPPTSSHAVTELLNFMWPLLTSIATYAPCRTHPSILTSLLSVHSKIVSSFGEVISSRLGEVINVVVQAYEEIYDVACLNFVGVAVEKFGPLSGPYSASFRDLLHHLTSKTLAHLNSKGIPSSTSIVAAFYGLAQRFLLFCPLGLVSNDSFPLIYSFAVACLTQCLGERDSTRAALIFLTQIIGRKGVRLSPSSRAVLAPRANEIDAHTARFGGPIVLACLLGAGVGGPPMLRGPFGDCLYAVVTHVMGADDDEGREAKRGRLGGPSIAWVIAGGLVVSYAGAVASRTRRRRAQGKRMPSSPV